MSGLPVLIVVALALGSITALALVLGIFIIAAHLLAGGRP